MTSIIDNAVIRRFDTNGYGQPRAHNDVFHGVAAAVGTSAFIPKMIGNAEVFVAVTGGETMKIQGSKDGTIFVDLTPFDKLTGNKTASVNLPSGNYILPLKNFGHLRQFKFIKSAGVQDSVVSLAVPRPFSTP